jgi:hypothetical protein
MEQRRLRLGDILDDYCPRERRVTNHAVVAMIEEDVKQTRCTTCDAEHPYKGARVPRRRKKETPAGLYKEVLAGMPDTENAPALAIVPAGAPALVSPLNLPVDAIPALDAVASLVAPVNNRTEDFTPAMHSDDNDQQDDRPETPPLDDLPAIDGPVHRPLIRATLPRPDGQKDTRPVPEFTVRHTPPRGNGNGHPAHGGGFRPAERMRMRSGMANGHPQREANGNRAQGGGGSRFHGRPAGGGRPGRTASGFRNADSGGKRGRGSRS